MSLHFTILAIIITAGCVGAWLWIRRPLGRDEPRGDDLLQLWSTIQEDERELERRFTQIAIAFFAMAIVGGLIAGIAAQVMR